MQSAMNRLSGFVRTRRKLVFGIWIGLLVLSVPFASQQTKHLSGGGFEVPGAGSDRVDKEIARFKGQSTEPLGIVLQAKGGELGPAIDRVQAAAAEVDHVELTPEAAQAAKQATPQDGVIVFPLAVTGTPRRRPQGRDRPARRPQGRRGHRRRAAVRRRPAGAVGGHAEAPAGGPREGRELRLPGDPDRAARGLRLGARGAAAGRSRRRGGDHHRRRVFFISLAITMSVFVTNVASMLGIGVAVDYSLFVLSRYREELHAGKYKRDRRSMSPCGPPARPSSSPASR